MTPQNAPMARVLSPLLMIGQWLCASGLVLVLLMAAFMAFPSGLRDNLLTHSPTVTTPATMMGKCLAGAVLAAGWFFVLKLLRQVVIAVVHGDPFLPENVARLRKIWIIFAIIEVFRMFAHLAFGENADAGSLLDIRLGTWFFIFIIAAISEAFRHGAALRAEQELTI